MSVFSPIIQKLRENSCFNTLRSVNIGYVQLNTQAYTEVLLPLLTAAPNLEEFIIYDSTDSYL